MCVGKYQAKYLVRDHLGFCRFARGGFIASGLDLGSNLIPSIFAIVESSSFSLRGGKGSIEFSTMLMNTICIYMARM